MAKTQVSTLELTCNTKRVRQELKEYERLAQDSMNKLAQLTDALNEKRRMGMEITKEESARLKKLEEDIKIYTSAQQKGVDDIVKAREVMKDLAHSSIKEVNKAIRDLTKEMNGLRDVNSIRKLQSEIDQMKESISSKKGLAKELMEANRMLKDLVSTPTDKLRQGLAAIRKELEQQPGDAGNNQWADYLRQQEKNIEAQLAINDAGRVVPSSSLAGVQQQDRMRLEAERSRLVSAYNVASQSTDQSHIAWANQALQRIQDINGALKQLIETERQEAQAAKAQAEARDKVRQTADVMTRLHHKEKVSLQELIAVRKDLEERLRDTQSINPDAATAQQTERLQERLELVKQTMIDIAQIDVQKTIDSLSDPNATTSLEQMETALKQLKESAGQIGMNDDNAFRKFTEDVTKLEDAIDSVKSKMQGLADIDFDNLDSVPTEKLEAALKQVEAQEKKLTATDTAAAKTMGQNKEKLRAQIEKNRLATMGIAEAEEVAGNTGKYNAKQLQAAYNALQEKLLSLDSSEKAAIKETRKQMETVKKAINEVKGEVTGLEKIWRTAVRNIATYVGVFAGFNFIKGKIMEVVHSTIELSDSMAQVQKVTGLTKKEVDSLNKSFAKLDTRTTLTQLNDLAYSAGKMGLGKYGVDGVRQFVEATNQLQVALGEDLGNSVEESITPLAKLAENLGMIQKMGVEKSMLAIGSSINELSQTTTATGKNIVDFARRIQPSAQMIGLTTDEILALGSASDSFGIASEISATAFTKFLAAYRTNAAEIERILGLTKGSLDQFFDQGRTMDGLIAIFQRMHEIGDLRYLQEAFKALGSEGSRMFTTFGAFSKNIDMFREHLETSTRAFNEATSVSREFALVQDTAAGILERANNIWEKAFVDPQGVDTVKEFAQAWYDVSKALTNNTFAMAQVKFLLAGIMELVKGIIYMMPALLNGLLVWGGARLAVALKAGLEIGKITEAVKGLTFSLGALQKAWSALSVVGKANWIGAAATAVYMIIEVLGMFNKKVEEATGYMRGFKKTLGDLEVEYGKGEYELRRYRRAIDEATVGTKQRQAAINQFNQKFKPYLSNLLTEKSTALDVAKAYQEVCKQLRAKIALEQKNKDIEEQVTPRERWTAERREEYDRQARGAGLGQYGADWITAYAEDNKSKSIDSLVRDIGKQYYNLPQQIVDEVAKQAAAGNREFNNYGNIINSRYLPQANALLAANSYLRQDRSTENAIRAVDKKWAPEQKRMEEYLAAQNAPTENIVIPESGDGGGGSGTTKAPEWMVEEKKEAEKATRAIIGSIEEFYRLQEAAANELAANGQLKGADFDMLINHIQDRKDKMLLEARRAIVGDPNEFENIRKSLETDIVKRDDAVSQAAMQRILEAEPARQGANLRKYNGSDAVYGLDSNAYLNDIRKNAAQNELNIQRRQAKLVEEIDKFLLQYQFVEQAQRDFGDKLVKLGLVSDGYAKVVKQLADGTTITANTNEVNQLANKVSGMGSKLYGVDITNSEELARMTKYMMTDSEGNEESFASIFPDYKKWLEQPEQYKNKMVALYELMIQYEGIYYDQIKKRDELQNKRIDSWWEHSDEKKQNDQALRSVDQYAFQYNNFAENQGMGYMMGLTNDVNQDPEVLREKAVLEAKMAIWQKAKEEREAGLISEEVYQQRVKEMQDQTMAYTEAVMANINKRIDRVKQFVKPVETAAKSIGQKLGDMIFNMESESQTWEEIWKNMALAVAESMLTMAGQYAQNAIVKASMNKAEETEEGAHATVMTMLGISEGAAKTIGTLGWLGIALIPVITSLLMGLLTSALSTKRDNGSTNGGKKVKLTSGMLTYDEGNVQTVVGDDGHVYRARSQKSLPEGVGIVKSPIATTVNGQQALVGERGPEIVVGRKTTRALMLNRPDILQALNTVDRGITTRRVRTFDEGNISDLASVFAAAQGDRAAVQSDNSTSDQSPSAAERDAMLVQTMQQMLPLMQGMIHLLENPVAPEIAMYGENGLHKKIKKADAFYARYGD